jgi:hypothetical protein
MGSIAKKFVSRSLMLALLLSLGFMALPVSPAAQNYPQAVVLEQWQREAARAQQQVQRRQRLAGEFAILLVKAKAQHAMIAQWRKAHSSELKIRAAADAHKKRFDCPTCF